MENEAKAVLVLQCTSRVGLWPLAIELLQRFPGSKRIKSTVVSRAEHNQEVITGPQSLHYENCASEMQKVLDGSKTPSLVRTFLEELRDRFREAASREQRIEEDEDVNW